MAFTDQQTRQLKAKLDAQHVKTRKADGTTLHYIEGWHVLAEANRIFGFDGWDRRTLMTNCIWTGTAGDWHLAAYVARVRIYVRAGDVLIVREGSGTGEGRAPTPGQAHEIALKTAETDATKRALATFGNVFGLALYDPAQGNVRQSPKGKSSSAGSTPKGPWILHAANGEPKGRFHKAADFIEALRKAMAAAGNIEGLFETWERNVSTVRELNAARQPLGLEPGFAQGLVAYLKSCAVALVKTSDDTAQMASSKVDPAMSRLSDGPKIDKSVLTIGEPKRIRSKEHLRFVAKQPCLVCGRKPSHAHHVRFAQPRGLSLKVSDEFTVPLCAIHHTENHATGDERAWWEQQKIDPLEVARTLWKEGRMPISRSAAAE
jgi:Rad52/22 family double-strand break repair protein